jgi:hypothetical protein
MDEFEPDTEHDRHTECNIDLARRLARYRRRLEAEGRQRSLRVIDRAIKDARSAG